MEGSVRRSGDRVRVTVLLIDAVNDQQIWSESYDRTLLDIFAIQSDIARQIVSNIQGELSPELYADIGARSTEDTAAYDLYLQARAGFQSDIRSAVILEEPLRLIRQALAIDPNFVEAWVELVRICGGLVWWDRPEYAECAYEALLQLRLLAPQNPRRVVAEGIYAYRIDRDFPKALELLRPMASELPNDAALLKFIHYSARRTARWDEAVAAMQKVILLGPRDESNHDDLLVTLAARGNWQEAVRFGEEAAAKFPDNRLLPFLAADLRRKYAGDLSAYGPAMLALTPSLRPAYGNPWIAGVFPDHQARRQWVAEAIGSGVVRPRWATAIEITHHRLEGRSLEARALSKEMFRQVQFELSDNLEREGPFNLSLLAMLAASAGDETTARRAIALVKAKREKEYDHLMEDNRMFIVAAYLELGDLDGAWEELKVLRTMALGPTVWDLRQDLVLQNYFANYPPFETFVSSANGVGKLVSSDSTNLRPDLKQPPYSIR
ncbi:putative adenylate cyclase protein [gamma proteobacterium NOR5-3]|nr:putative adenylate cyclase protein [gamma proteobacterium NOR5-3]